MSPSIWSFAFFRARPPVNGTGGAGGSGGAGSLTGSGGAAQGSGESSSSGSGNSVSESSGGCQIGGSSGSSHPLMVLASWPCSCSVAVAILLRPHGADSVLNPTLLSCPWQDASPGQSRRATRGAARRRILFIERLSRRFTAFRARGSTRVRHGTSDANQAITLR